MRVFGIIVGGGQGKRMGTDIPKQLLKLDGVTIIERTLRPFIRCQDVEGIVIVAAENIVEHIEKILHNYTESKKLLTVIKGGTERQDSVWNGLNVVPDGTDVVVIHDAVRPFITSSLITECVQSAMKLGAVTVTRPIKETVKEIDDNVIIRTLDRSRLCITQTPQVFRTELILEAHKHAREENYVGTDDCILVERLGHPVHSIKGNEINIKITTPVDLKIAGAILSIFNKLED